MPMRVLTAIALILCVVATPVYGKKKKKADEEPPTQTLPVIPDPPLAITADATRLVFRVAPLSSKGLLSQQIRDSIKALLQANRGLTIVKIRGFVAGTGDMRRVQTLVSEIFAEKKLPLPVVSTVQAGALPMEGSQVVLESIAMDRKAPNPQGIAIIGALPLDQLDAARKSLGGNRVLKASCFVSSLEASTQFRTAAQNAFPGAALNIIQMQRLPVRTPDACELVAALERADPPHNPNIAVTASSKLILTSTQLAFHAQDADIRLAFDRLRKTLEAAGASYKNVIAANIYPLADDIATKVRAAAPSYFNGDHPPVVSMVPIESLPSLDATFAIEAIAAQ